MKSFSTSSYLKMSDKLGQALALFIFRIALNCKNVDF